MTRERTGPEQRFVGAWRLISWKATDASGEVRQPHGETPEGQIIYTANGQMSAQLMSPGAVLPDVNGLTAKEVLARVATTFFAYHGTYAVDERARTVTHRVVGSLAPSWVGTDQVRAYEFSSDDRLTLTARIRDDSVAKAAGATGHAGAGVGTHSVSVPRAGRAARCRDEPGSGPRTVRRVDPCRSNTCARRSHGTPRALRDREPGRSARFASP